MGETQGACFKPKLGSVLTVEALKAGQWAVFSAGTNGGAVAESLVVRPVLAGLASKGRVVELVLLLGLRLGLRPMLVSALILGVILYGIKVLAAVSTVMSLTYTRVNMSLLFWTPCQSIKRLAWDISPVDCRPVALALLTWDSLGASRLVSWCSRACCCRNVVGVCGLGCRYQCITPT